MFLTNSNNINIIKRIIIPFIAIAVLLSGCSGKDVVESTISETDNDITITKDNAENHVEDEEDSSKESLPTDLMQVHFVDVGQGDCSLIICNNEAMLIDAGDNDKGTRVQKYLRDQGISNLKYVIGTHPDADHIGGLDVVIYKFDCENVLMPNAQSDSKSYLDVLAAVDSKGYKVTTVGQGDIFFIGNASFEILSPVKEHPYADDNNNSIILRLNYYNNSFLFTGDAEYQPQQVIIYDDEINAKADVIKVPHHGSDNSYMKAFYDEVAPEYAVISVGNGNKFGHPHANLLNDLKNRGIKVFRTDESGSIIATSDGNTITFNVEPSVTWASGETLAVENEADAKSSDVIAQNTSEEHTDDVTYVLNISSMKFHYPTCESVSDMKEKNRIDVTCTREDFVKEYPNAVPCKRCNP